MSALNEALASREQQLGELEAISLAAIAEGREPTADETKRFDEVEASMKTLDKNIERLQAVQQSQITAAKQKEAIETKAVGRPPVLPPAPASNVNMQFPVGDERTLQHYSVQNVFKASIKNKPLEGLEGEMQEEGRREMLPVAAANEGGHYVPFSALAAKTIDRLQWERQRAGNFRADLGAVDNKGGQLIEESRLMSPIDILYHYMVLNQLGVPTFTGLGPDIRYPIMSAGSDTASEKAQDADATVLNPTTDDLELSPKRLPVLTKLNQQIVLQSTSFNVEAWLLDYLMKTIAQRIQDGFINGTGTAPQPQGLLATATAPLAAAQTIAAGTNGDDVTRDKLLALQLKIDENNAMMGRTGFLMNSKTRNKLQRTLITTGDARFVMEGNSIPSIGEPVAVTNQVPSNGSKGTGTGLSTVLYGNWQDSIIAQWGGMWTLRDPYTQAGKGLTSIHCAVYYDTKVLRPVSFAKAVHLKTA